MTSTDHNTSAEAPGARVAGDRPVLAVRDLGIRYGSRYVLREVSFEVAPGEVVGLIGESGSGKTSLARTVLGLVPAADGSVVRGASLVGAAAAEAVPVSVGAAPEAPTKSATTPAAVTMPAAFRLAMRAQSARPRSAATPPTTMTMSQPGSGPTAALRSHSAG